MTIKTIGIIGAGTMGNGIAQAFAIKGFDVIMQDIADVALQKGLATISGSLDRQIKKGTLTEESKQNALGHICTSTQVSDLAKADIVIEAATENEAVKIKILQGVEAVLRPETIIATNTSSLSITKLAAATKRPTQMVGMHFFNPVPMMALVEIIRGLQTSEATVQAVTELAKARMTEGVIKTGRASRLPHTLYVLDEPTVGLSMADVEKLIRVLHRLVEAGNTVVVIEHNLDVIAEADWLLDLGPEGGTGGGKLVVQGPPEQVMQHRAQSHTGQVVHEFMHPAP